MLSIELETFTKNTKLVLGISLGCNLSFPLLWQINILLVMWQWIVLTIILVCSMAYAAYRVYLSLSDNDNLCHGIPWLQRVHIISALVYMQKETLHHIIISHLFSRLFSHSPISVTVFSNELTCNEKWLKAWIIFQSKIRRWHLINCMTNNI